MEIDQGPMASDQGKRKEPLKSAYSGLGFEMSEAQTIVDTCLLERDRRIVEELQVPSIVGKGFVCLNKVSPAPFLPPFLSCIC